MKGSSSFLIVTAVCLAPLCLLRAQGPAIALQNVCWTTPAAVDSNIVAYWLISSRDSVPKLINYLDAQGQTVVVSGGGTFQTGFCCCTGSGADGYRTVASRTDSLLGLTTFTVGFIDTVGLDIASLTQSAPKGDGYLVFYDELTNRNYKILLSTLMPEPYPGYTSCECDTIYQVSHGFARGDIVGQVRGNGPFFEASTGDPDSLPVAYVHEVLHADTFVIKSEGWLMDWTHGLPLGRDYFVQDTPGTLDTIPDSTYSVFAYRTVNTTKAYFDIPELVVDQSPGGGGGGTTTLTFAADSGTPIPRTDGETLTIAGAGIASTSTSGTTVTITATEVDGSVMNEKDTVTTLIQDSILVYSLSGVEVGRDTIPVGLGGGSTFSVTASNGLNDQDAGTDVDVELGGTLDKATDVINPSFLFRLGKVSGANINYLFNNGSSNQSGFFSSNSGTTEEGQLQFGPALIQLQSSINSLANATLMQMQDEVVTLYSQVSSIARGVVYIDTSQVRIRFNNNSGNVQSAINWDNTSLTMSTYNSTGAVVQTEIKLTDDNIEITGIPNYASNAAADADGGLCSGCVYTVTAEDRTIRIKP